MRLSDIPTPALILDRRRLQKNVERMAGRAKHLGVALRPHVKTAKCAAVTRLATEGQPGGIIVSTLKEAQYFFEQGFDDMIYGVGIVPGKLDAIDALQTKGAHIRIILDHLDTARAVAKKVEMLANPLDVLIEIDSGGHRGGVRPDSEDLIEIGRVIEASPRLNLTGVLSHAGHSYGGKTLEALVEIAEQERFFVVSAAERLRSAALTCPIVSVGATPTALFAEHLAGVTEMRPGVYTLFDLTQVELGCCALDDVAVSVLASVIGHGDGVSYGLIDAGALALSKDISANDFNRDTGYGLVFDELGRRAYHGLRVSKVQQEHGFITAGSAPLPYAKIPLGSRVRVFPNHACMTAAPYDKYYVVDGADEVVDIWEKITGW